MSSSSIGKRLQKELQEAGLYAGESNHGFRRGRMQHGFVPLKAWLLLVLALQILLAHCILTLSADSPCEEIVGSLLPLLPYCLAVHMGYKPAHSLLAVAVAVLGPAWQVY